MEIKASQVKELRDMSGFAIMECKRALVDCEGDFQKALHLLRSNSAPKAEKQQIKKLQKKMHNLGALIKKKMINFALQKRWTIILSLYLVVIYYSISWFSSNFVLREYQEGFEVIVALYCVWGMFKVITNFFKEDEESSFKLLFYLGLIPIVALLDNLINMESELLTTYIVMPILLIIWRFIKAVVAADPAPYEASSARGNRKSFFKTEYPSRDEIATRYTPRRRRKEMGEFGESSFTNSIKAEPFVETKADNRKTVYEVHVRTGAAGYQFYTSMDTLAKAEWAADQQRKYGKEVKVVPMFK